MDNDDRPVGRVLSRREVLALFGTASAAFLAACSGLDRNTTPTSSPAQPTAELPPATQPPASPGTGPSPAALPTNPPTSAPTMQQATVQSTTVPAQPAATPTTLLPATGAMPVCIARPEQTEGPYFFDERLDRADIRSDPVSVEVKEGVPLQLTVRVSQVNGTTCAPLAGATVDVWHCDALGVYSGVDNAADAQFLRGYQVTDANGQAAFTTIYPGWYPGRAVHIHFKIRTDPDAQNGYEFTSQLYFDDALTDQVMQQPPYNSRGQRRTRNSSDGPFRSGGDQLTLSLTPSGDGYTTVFDIGLQIA